MGCCVSRSSPSSPYSPAEPSASSRAINTQASQSAIVRPSTNHTTSSQQQAAPPTTHSAAQSSHQRQPQTLGERWDQPLKLHVWKSKKRTWTRRQLDREREEFFDTRVTGQPEVWQTLRAALEVLWAGGDPGADNDGGIATAQVMLSAAGITLPTGDLAGSQYDGNGIAYNLPEHIVSDPTNMVIEENGKDGEGSGDKDADGSSGVEDEEEMMKRREEKGKTVLALQDMIFVKARLSVRSGPAADIAVQMGKEESVRLLAKRVAEEAELLPTQNVSIVYMGKRLKENEALLAQNWKEGHLVNAFVFES